ncbi:MAG TPA: MFS transporter [Jatrophihabitantaceae bacterium]|jgi:MFS family permease|nr:MFS transporter [Jatrophihabitantaceae bacterium]
MTSTAPAGVRPATGRLWRHRDFRRLWAAQTVSRFGSMVSELALPLTAILVVHASTLQVGLLTAVESVAFLLVGLPAGAWVDRMRTRQVLIVTDALRAVALASIPVAAVFDVLTMAQLYVVALGTGVCTVFFDVGFQSYLPQLVERRDLVDGNAKLQISESIAQIAGPSLGGLLVQALTAPYAVLVDAVSFVFSAAWVGRIEARSPKPRREPERSLVREIGAGVRFVFGHRLLRPILTSTAVINLFHPIGFAVYVLLLARTLHLSPALIGLIAAVASVGALLAAMSASRLAARFGPGRTIVVSLMLCGPASFVIPFVEQDWTLLLLTASQGLYAACVVTYNITQVSLRQALCPPNLLGRMNATVRFVVWGLIPIGAAIGAVLGSWLGLRPTLVISAIGVSFGFLPVLLSPVRKVRDVPVWVDG